MSDINTLILVPYGIRDPFYDINFFNIEVDKAKEYIGDVPFLCLRALQYGDTMNINTALDNAIYITRSKSISSVIFIEDFKEIRDGVIAHMLNEKIPFTFLFPNVQERKNSTDDDKVSVVRWLDVICKGDKQFIYHEMDAIKYKALAIRECYCSKYRKEVQTRHWNEYDKKKGIRQ